jgi:Heavy metal binding domain
MRKTVLKVMIAGAFAIGSTMMVSCGSNHEHEAVEHEHMEGEEHDSMEADDNGSVDGEMQDHEGMEMGEAAEISECPKWENGEHEHTSYVCPMWEEEGELEEAGDCPKCGMTLLVFADVKDQHDAQNPESDEHHPKEKQ